MTTKPVAEIVAEIMNDNWPNHTGGWVCNYADVEACLAPVIAELTRLIEELKEIEQIPGAETRWVVHENVISTDRGFADTVIAECACNETARRIVEAHNLIARRLDP